MARIDEPTLFLPEFRDYTIQWQGKFRTDSVMQKVIQDNIKFLAGTIETEVRRLLEDIGLSIGPNASAESIQTQMEVMDIEVVHIGLEDPVYSGLDGWFFYHKGKLIAILTDPKMDEKGNVKMERKWTVA